MILDTVKRLLKIGHSLLFKNELKRTTSIHFEICCFSFMSPELVAARIFTGISSMERQILIKFGALLTALLPSFFCACSFLKRLYSNAQECPRSYDKLRFDPRYQLSLYSNSLFLMILVFHLFAQPNVQFLMDDIDKIHFF